MKRNLGFFHGAHLEDPARLLKGSGKNMRHVKLRAGRPCNTAALENLIDAAYIDLKLRLRAEKFWLARGTQEGSGIARFPSAHNY